MGARERLIYMLTLLEDGDRNRKIQKTAVLGRLQEKDKRPRWDCNEGYRYSSLGVVVDCEKSGDYFVQRTQRISSNTAKAT